MVSRAKVADQFCYDGQSLVLQPSGAAFPVTVAAAFPGHAHDVVAIGGSAYNQRRLAPSQRTDKFLSTTAGRKILVDCGGTTDVALTTAGSLPAWLTDQVEGYWKARREAGWDIIIAATCTDSSTFDVDADARRVTFNTFVENAVGRSVGGTLLLDAFVDFRLDADLEDWSSGAFVNDYPGAEPDVFVHPTAATAEFIMAPRFISVLQSVL